MMNVIVARSRISGVEGNKVEMEMQFDISGAATI
jgi:hypothetical protein